MKLKSKVTVGVLAAVIVAGGAVAAGAVDNRPAQPKIPPWVDAKTGIVDQSKMPDYMPVPGPDGKNLKGADGKDVMVQVRKGPPPLPQAEQDILSGKKTRTQVEAEQAKETKAPGGVEEYGDIPAK